MTCKHLHPLSIAKPVEIGDPIIPSEPSTIVLHDCGLERLQSPSEAKRCQATADNGPCWWWQEQHPGQPDNEF